MRIDIKNRVIPTDSKKKLRPAWLKKERHTSHEEN